MRYSNKKKAIYAAGEGDKYYLAMLFVYSSTANRSVR